MKDLGDSERAMQELFWIEETLAVTTHFFIFHKNEWNGVSWKCANYNDSLDKCICQWDIIRNEHLSGKMTWEEYFGNKLA